MTLSQLVFKGLSFGYGTLGLAAFLLLASVRKSAFKKLNAEEKKELAAGKYAKLLVNMWS
jgi:hypothetical protein